MVVKKPNFAPGDVKDHLCSRYRHVGEFEQLTEGEESQAFAFEGDGESLVVRINKTRTGFDKDHYAHRHFASAGLPVPEIRSVEAFDDQWLCISVRAPGQTLQALSSEAANYAQAVADAMDAIASTDVSTLSGFGAFNASGRGPFNHWCEYLTAIGDPNYFDWSAVSGIAPSAKVQPLLDRVTELAPTCPEIRQLVHADFGSNNVLVSSGQVTAVIDWSEAMLGDSLYDVASTFFWRTWLACMDQQAKFFEPHLDRRGWDADRLLCYQLRVGLQSAHDAATDGDADFVNWALNRCGSLASLQ